MDTKQALRKTYRDARRDHFQAQPQSIRALLFHRPPAPLLELIPNDATIGLYAATGAEAPTTAYAKFFHEHGHALALPRFTGPDKSMEFAAYDDPFAEGVLEEGPYSVPQPSTQCPIAVPDILFVPLVAFTRDGERLGQGGGHYDRWLADNTAAKSIGLAWDVQLADSLPVEPHDRSLTAIVTPTRFYGPFA